MAPRKQIHGRERRQLMFLLKRQVRKLMADPEFMAQVEKETERAAKRGKLKQYAAGAEARSRKEVIQNQKVKDGRGRKAD